MYDRGINTATLNMIAYFNQQQVRGSLAYSQLIPALRLAFSEKNVAPARHVHTVSAENNTSLLLMPVWQENAHAGVKLVTVAPHNKHAPSVHAIFILFDSASGVPLAIMDGEELTARRTAAASALASEYLSRTDSRHLLVVGNGSLASHMAVAHCQTRAISSITVWGRSVEKSMQCAAAIRHHVELPSSVKVIAEENLEAACDAADIISCVTTSKMPVVPGKWVRKGTHLDLVGGFKPDMREVDDELMRKAMVVVDTYTGAMTEAGDILQPLANGSLVRESIVAELADLCGQRHLGRIDHEQITVFKSVGSAVEDLCAANLVWNAAQAAPHQTI
ncbi:ornithine cyclodeaminase family protein [Undibacterium sp. SXout7W]|uniref:ornithine cyclodeaminase family protein n=1 Tax=Undibacterium sp. SXout7W TaxID=3413049 RepID=UPI003BF43926